MHQVLYIKSLHYTTKMNVLQMQEIKEYNELSKQALGIICEWTKPFKTELGEVKSIKETNRDQLIVYKNEDEDNRYRSTDQGEIDLLLQRIRGYEEMLWRYAGNILQIEKEINEIDQLVASINIAVE